MADRDDLARLITANTGALSGGQEAADAILAAGWMTEERWTEEAEAAALAEMDADGRSTNPGLVRVTAERDALAAMVQRVRDLCERWEEAAAADIGLDFQGPVRIGPIARALRSALAPSDPATQGATDG